MHSMFGGNAYQVAMIQHFSFTFFPFFAIAMRLFSTAVTSSNLHNQAPLFTELRLLQGSHSMFGRNAYDTKFLLHFFFFFAFARNFYPLRLRHKISATKLRYLWSSAFCRSPRIRMAWCNSNKRFSLSFKQHGSRSLGVTCYGCYANVFEFDSLLVDFTIFSLLFIRLTCYLYGLVYC